MIFIVLFLWYKGIKKRIKKTIVKGNNVLLILNPAENVVKSELLKKNRNNN